MSKTIDQKVVEMQFDNRQFEKNVSTTMSSIDKLKQKLNFSGAEKGLDNVSAAAKRVDMNGLGSAVDTVRSKFSALEVMGITALANITNSAVNAGKRIMSALTIEPIMTGFQEYETQMNAVQTILANTQSKGSTLEDVNSALDELNKYADQTIYNFTEMTKNIGTFTAAGVGLEESVNAIKGIANLAAVSGSNSQQAATAMYQLSQALAAGRVSLMDWNSVVNAGMGGEVFQTALIRTARQMGTGVDEAIKKYGTFRESLTKGQWLTAEVLTETLAQISGAYTEAELIAQGYSKESAKAIVELANTAVGAATDVKTFTQMWDTMKESVQSGWAQSWQTIIGDFEQSKELFSEINGVIAPLIENASTARNEFLSGALDSNWEKLIKQVNAAGIETKDFTAELEKTARAANKNYDTIIEKHGSLAKAFMAGELSSNIVIDTLKRMAGITGTTAKTTESMTVKLEEYSKVVNQIINGDFKNGQERIEALTKAGYDNVAAQKLVNYVWERNGKNWSNTTISAEELTKVLGELSTSELENIGYTKEEANALKDLARQAEETGTPINELIMNLTKPSGRELLWDSILNILQSIVAVFKAIKVAWNDAFPPMASSTLYNIIEGFHAWSENLKDALVATEGTTDTIDKLTRTFKGLFAILDIFTSIVGGGFKMVFRVISEALGLVDVDILDFTARLGDAAVGLRNFLLENELVTKAFELAATGVRKLIEAFKDLIEFIGDLPFVQDAIEGIKNALAELPEIANWAIEGFKNGFSDGIKSIPSVLIDIGKKIIEAIKGVLGIHSPSVVMISIGLMAAAGLVLGLTQGFDNVFSTIKSLGQQAIDIITDLPWGKIAAVAIIAGLLYTINRLVNAFNNLTAPLEGLGEVFESFSNVLDAKALQLKADAIRSIAISVAILAASVAVLSFIDPGKLWNAIGALTALSAVFAGLMVVISKFGPDKALKFTGIAAGLVGISASILILAIAVKKIESVGQEGMNKALGVVLAFTGIISVLTLMAEMGGTNAKAVGSMMLRVSIAMILMVEVVKMISGLSEEEIVKGVAVITAFGGITGALTVLSVFSGKNASKVGTLMIKLSFAIALMVGVMKLISGLSYEEIIKGVATITAFAGITGALSVLSLFSSKNVSKLGSMLAKTAVSIAIMTGVIKLISTLSYDEIVKGIATITVLGTLMTVLSLFFSIIGKIGGDDLTKISVTLLSISVSIGILAGIAAVLSFIDIAGLIKGIAAVSILGALVAAITLATRGSKDVHKNFTSMAIAIGVIAAAVAILSFIKPEKLAASTAAIGVLMGMFALIVKSGSNIKSSMSTLIVMSVAIGLLSGSLYLIAQLPAEEALPAAAALSTLMLAVSGAMLMISKSEKIKSSAIGAIAMMELALLGLSGILAIITNWNIDVSLETVISLSILLEALSAATLILSKVGPSASLALKGALALDGVIVVIGALIAALGGLSKIPGFNELMADGGQALIGIGETIGGFVGGLIGGIAGGLLSGITSGLPAMAEDLSDFIDNLEPFIAGAKSIGKDESALTGIGHLATMILTLTAADFVNGISNIFSIFTGKSSFEDLGEDLKTFGQAVVDFSKVVSGNIDEGAVTAAANAGQTLSSLYNNIPKEGGILQDFLGTQDLGSFGEQLKKFGQCLVDFSGIVSGNIDPTAMDAAAQAGLALANLANNIPKQDGILQDFLGEQDLSTFGKQLKTLGAGIKDFANEVKDVNPDIVTQAANAGMALSELANNIPSQDGMLQDFLGEKDLATFGSQLKTLGTGIRDFAVIVEGINPDVVTQATNAGLALAGLNDNIPKSNGVFQDIFGEKSMETFGKQLVAFGQSFATYSTYMSLVNTDVVNKTTLAAESLVALQEKLPENKLFKNETWLDEFGEDLSSFGSYFYAYYASISGIDTTKLATVLYQVSRIVDMANNMTDLDTSGMTGFGSALKTMGDNGIDEFIGAFENSVDRIITAASNMVNTFATSVSNNLNLIETSATTLADGMLSKIDEYDDDFKLSGEDAVTRFASGITGKITFARIAFNDVVSSMLNNIRSRYQDFHNAGGYLVDGFNAGMSSKMTLVISTAAAMANAAYNSAMKALNARSPSRKFMAVGSYVTLGFARGIDEGTSEIQASADNMAKAAINSTQKTISKLVDAINTDVDTQPTIRPVLDLSSIEQGTGRLNAMFSRNRALSVSSSIERQNANVIQNGDSNATPSAMYQFTQNNYSPKALSRIEIYRQTKNQFSALERMVKT